MALLLAVEVLASCGSHHRYPSPALGASTTPARTTANAVGPPPDMPWWSRGVLHVEGRTIRTSLSRIVARGGTTLVGTRVGDGATWRRVVGARLVPLVSSHHMASPSISSNGAHIAWVTSHDLHRYNPFTTRTAFTVTSYDVRGGRRVASTTLVSRATCCDGGGAIDIAGVDDDGAVVLVRYADRAWAWRPGGGRVDITRSVRPDRMPGNDQWPGGISWTVSEDSSAPSTFGRVSASGSVTRVGRVPVSQGGLWSPDGTAYAYAPFRTSGDVRPVVWRDGRRQVLHAPRGSWPLAWETGRRVLLVNGDLDVSIDVVRCWTDDGRCERAGPPLRHARVPDPFVF